MVTLVLAALALAVHAQAAPVQRPTGPSLVDCRLARINFETRRPEADGQRFVLLLGAPQGDRHMIAAADVRVFDPSNLLMDQRFDGAFYSEDPNMLFAQTGNRAYFRLAVSLVNGMGALGLNGEGSREEHMSRSYMGDCRISEPADAAAQFEALGNGQ